MGRHKHIVLASSSTWRLALLRAVGIDARAVGSRVDEGAFEGETPEATARLRAEAKARDVSSNNPGALVIGADQVAHFGDLVFGKPESDDVWRTRLTALRGKAHVLTTGVALAEEGEVVDVFAVSTIVRFRDDLSDAEIDAYIALGEARGCAGGYMAESRGAWLIDGIEGDWHNVIGLPIFPLLDRLRARGYRLPVPHGPSGGRRRSD